MYQAAATLLVGFIAVGVTIATQLVVWGVFRGKVIARIDATDRRVDELRENQGRIFERLDVHTADIGFIQGKLNGNKAAVRS
jgi:peptidoglycan hydrolase CwlO-like protein